MTLSNRTSPYGAAYVAAVIALGVIVIGSSIHHLAFHPIPLREWFLLAVLTLVSGSATVKLPSIAASISVSETFVFTAVLLYGPAAGTLIVALDGLVMSFWIARRYSQPSRALFNMSAPALSAWCSAQLFFYLANITPLNSSSTGTEQTFPALIVFALTYFGINSWLITWAIALHTRSRALDVWRSNFIWLSINYFCGASVAFLLVAYRRHVDVQYVGLIVPLLLVLYLTFRTSMARVEDANRHVAEVSKLYVSTMEALAMAIDAKDQITHGHIRRVQEYAIGLATHLGVADAGLIKAIAAAALLHDMGKLAVPEHILNKPGKLTPAEFDKMKLHATIGADILSAVDFPYPVVPIVRHHHEHWNGGGYPIGLSGVDIPIGARILAVVDCFDALTSDRPYRPRLSEEAALHILVEQRGTLYDPLVVDTFLRVYKDIAPSKAPTTSERLFDEITTGAHTGDVIAVDRRPRFSKGVVDVSEIATNPIWERVAKSLQHKVPCSTCVFYHYDPIADQLVATYTFGESSSLLLGFKQSLGKGISGWVAANRRPVMNSDPLLDLAPVRGILPSQFRLCLSTPVITGGHLIGVFSIYSSSSESFNDQHLRTIETVISRLASTATSPEVSELQETAT